LEQRCEDSKILLEREEQKSKELKSELMKNIMLLQRREKELRDFERVLLKAEETIDKLKSSI
jgi:dephospho-CoA kinase